MILKSNIFTFEILFYFLFQLVIRYSRIFQHLVRFSSFWFISFLFTLTIHLWSID